MDHEISRNIRRHLPSLAFVGLAGAVIGVFTGVFIYAGIYNIGADAPHTKPVYWAIQNLRDRSISARAGGITVPTTLKDPNTIATGAGLYAEMCSGCHLAPGLEKTEISQGLYPPAPPFVRGSDRAPAEVFWIIKHGIKMTAMPAWGRTHNDELVWSMVAFVQELPSLSPGQYQMLIKSASLDHDETMQNSEGAPKPGKKMEGMEGTKNSDGKGHH